MVNIFEHYLLGEKLYSQIVSTVYKKYNLTYMEFTVIMFLANNKQYDTASDIVKYRCLTKSHVSLSIKSLEDKNLLTGSYFGNDRRSIHLKLTELTKPIINDGRIAQQQYVNLLNNGLTETDKQNLIEYIEIINNNIKDNLDDYRRK